MHLSVAHESSKVNLDFLVKELGLRQERNTTIFLKGNFFVISPSVQNQYNWFDISEPIMEYYNPKVHDGYLLVRFKEEYLMAKLLPFQQKMMIKETMPNTTKLRPHWKFKVMEATKSYILNMGDRDLRYPIQMPSENQLKKFFNK